MLLIFNVDKQIITRTDSEKIVTDSMNYLYAQFSFSDEWTGEKTAVFKCQDGTYNALLDEENKCLVPWEVLTDSVFYVSVFCGDLITANKVPIFTIPSGYDIGDESRTPTPDIYNQVIEKLNEIEAEVDPEAIAQTVDAYLADKDFVTESDVERIVSIYEERTLTQIHNIKDGLNDVNKPDSSYKKDLLADSILYDRFVEGKYVSTSNGAELDSATLCASDYYDLEGAESISFKFFNSGSAVSMNLVYYDENHSYINGFNGAAVEKEAIPYNARYARFNFFKDETDAYDKANHYVYLYYEDPKAKIESQLLCGNIVENVVAAGKYKNGYYISISDGAEQTNAILSVSDYIDIHHIDSLTAGFWYSNKNQSHSLCIYDENKNRIAGYAGAEQTISLPSNAYYMRFNLFVAEITGEIDQSKHFLYASSGQRTPIKLITHTVVAKPLQFDGEDLVIFGDSIAKGYASNPLEVIDNPWVNQFATRANANLNNRAASGTTLAVRDGRSDSVYEKVSAFTGNADIIFVAGGTNDYGNNVPVGSYTDATPNTIYGALNGICNTLKTNYPNVPVIFITPINRSNLVGVEEISYFNSIRNAIYEKATANGYYVIDGIDLGFPDVQGAYQQAVIYDNLHPTVQGHKMYADAVSGILL